MKNKKLILSVLIVFLFVVWGAGAQAYEIGPKITFTFDDVNRRVYELAAPILKEYNFPGVLYAETKFLNLQQDWTMTWDQIRDLQNNKGWEIGSHTINHPDLTKVSNTQLRQELLTSKNSLTKQGLKIDAFATPYGEFDQRVLSEVAKHYKSHRAAGGGANSMPEFDGDYALTVYAVEKDVPPETVVGWINNAVAQNQWIILLFHDIVSGQAQDYEYNAEDFRKIVGAAALSNAKVVTVSDGLNLSTNKNLVSNFSFTNVDKNGWATNWQRDNKSVVKIDTSGQGDYSGTAKCLSITGGQTSNQAYTKIIPVSFGKEYMLRMFQNVKNYQNGGWAVWVDEFSADQSWAGGQWLGGNYSSFTGKRYYSYSPLNSSVKYVSIVIYSEKGSSFTLFIDNVEFKQL